MSGGGTLGAGAVQDKKQRPRRPSKQKEWYHCKFSELPAPRQAQVEEKFQELLNASNGSIKVCERVFTASEVVRGLDPDRYALFRDQYFDTIALEARQKSSAVTDSDQSFSLTEGLSATSPGPPTTDPDGSKKAASFFQHSSSGGDKTLRKGLTPASFSKTSRATLRKYNESTTAMTLTRNDAKNLAAAAALAGGAAGASSPSPVYSSASPPTTAESSPVKAAPPPASSATSSGGGGSTVEWETKTRFGKKKAAATIAMSVKSDPRIESIRLPPDIDKNEWITCYTEYFFQAAELIFTRITGLCTDDTCPVMNAGPSYTYKFLGNAYKKPTSLAAHKYISELFDWIDAQLNTPSIFPADETGTYGSQFIPTISDIFKRLFRVYAHIYHSHLEAIQKQGAEDLLNQLFTHMTLFILEFNLVQMADMKPLQMRVQAVAKMMIDSPSPSS